MRDQAPSGFTIFCDDVRHEVLNKFTYIGVYRSHLEAETYPLILPKFGVVINYSQGLDLPRLPLTLKVTYEHDGGETAELLSADIPSEAQSTSGELQGDLLGAVFEVVFSPLQLDRPGIMRVRAHRDGELVRLGSLPFRKVLKLSETEAIG